jgi:hypothetical protein
MTIRLLIPGQVESKELFRMLLRGAENDGD